VAGWGAAVVPVLLLTACDNGGKQALDDATQKVTICHFASSGHYNANTVSKESVINGDTGHQGHDNDVIPPFTYREKGQEKTFPGLNYSGQVDGECNPTAPATAAPPTSPSTTLPTSTTTTTTTSPSTTTTSTTVPESTTTTTEATTTAEATTTTAEGETTTGAGATSTSPGETTTTTSRVIEIPPTTIVTVTDPGGSTVTTTGGAPVTVHAVVATNPDGTPATDANGDAEVLGIVITNPDGTPVTDAAGGLVTLPVQETIARTGSDSPSLVPAGVFFIALGGFAIALMARLRRLPRG
jgi:hypothetical protein